jgi:acyl-CoA reductase-like NAD-dependent aldehyde dehydrogenase
LHTCKYISNPDARTVAVVERDADIQEAAKAIVSARFSLRGRSPYAPDVVLVNEWVKKEFLSAVMQCSLQFMPVANERQVPDEIKTPSIVQRASKEGYANIISSGRYGTILELVNRYDITLPITQI